MFRFFLMLEKLSRANQTTGFYVKWNTRLKWVKIIRLNLFRDPASFRWNVVVPWAWTQVLRRFKPWSGVSEIRGGEDLWQWSRLEIKLNAFRRSTIPQKQFIIIIIMIKFSPVFWILGKLNVFPIVIVNKGFNFRNSFWIMINIVMIQ